MKKYNKNKIYVSGKIISIEPSELKGKKIYNAKLEVMRKSGTCDIIPVVLKHIPKPFNEMIGERISLLGEIHSLNRKRENETKSHLVTEVVAKEGSYPEEDNEDSNKVILEGYISKKPIHRKTPLGREITEIFLAVNRKNGPADYIPCICWGKIAESAAELSIGNKITIYGRLQSRTYLKKYEDGTSEEKIAYEVSANGLFVEKEIENSKEETENEDLQTAPKE